MHYPSPEKAIFEGFSGGNYFHLCPIRFHVDLAWYCLDDFNTETGSCTMQLVKTVIHSQVEHTGGVRMWELLYGGATGAVKYAP